MVSGATFLRVSARPTVRCRAACWQFTGMRVVRVSNRYSTVTRVWPIHLWFVASAHDNVTATVAASIYHLRPADRGMLTYQKKVVRLRRVAHLYSLHEVLKSGVVLCNLARAIEPDIIKPPSKLAAPFKQMENIGNYLSACTKLGNKPQESFGTQGSLGTPGDPRVSAVSKYCQRCKAETRRAPPSPARGGGLAGRIFARLAFGPEATPAAGWGCWYSVVSTSDGGVKRKVGLLCSRQGFSCRKFDILCDDRDS